MEKNYIAKRIRAYYLKHTLVPILLIFFSLFLHISFKSLDVLFPEYVGNNNEIQCSSEYIRITIDDLYPAGYQMISGNSIMGNYYYGFYNDKCLYVILPLSSTADGEKILHNYTVFGKIVENDPNKLNITDRIGNDLNWTSSSLANFSYPFTITNISSYVFLDKLLAYILLMTIIISAIRLVYDIIAAFFQHLSRPGIWLSKYGNTKELLALADEELTTLPQLATEDMFITEHFFIEISVYGIAIVPIDQIVWIYKHSTLHAFGGLHLNISYTLHISCHKKLYFNCPKNIKSDIDGIIDYLSEANHDILVGFSPENKALAKEKTANEPGVFSFLKNI